MHVKSHATPEAAADLLRSQPQGTQEDLFLGRGAERGCCKGALKDQGKATVPWLDWRQDPLFWRSPFQGQRDAQHSAPRASIPPPTHTHTVSLLEATFSTLAPSPLAAKAARRMPPVADRQS